MTQKLSKRLPCSGMGTRNKGQVRTLSLYQGRDVNMMDEDIFVNRPKVCRPPMRRESVSKEIEEKKFDVIKQVVQLHDRPIEWLNVVALTSKRHSGANLETETCCLS